MTTKTELENKLIEIYCDNGAKSILQGLEKVFRDNYHMYDSRMHLEIADDIRQIVLKQYGNYAYVGEDVDPNIIIDNKYYLTR